MDIVNDCIEGIYGRRAAELDCFAPKCKFGSYIADFSKKMADEIAPMLPDYINGSISDTELYEKSMNSFIDKYEHCGDTMLETIISYVKPNVNDKALTDYFFAELHFNTDIILTSAHYFKTHPDKVDEIDSYFANDDLFCSIFADVVDDYETGAKKKFEKAQPFIDKMVSEAGWVGGKIIKGSLETMFKNEPTKLENKLIAKMRSSS